MIEVTMYESADGKRFSTPEECQNWESNNITVIDQRFIAVFDTESIYYMESSCGIQRVKFVGIEETTEIDTRWDVDGNNEIMVQILERTYNFIGVDDPTQEFNCWRESQLPTKDLRSLFNFDIAAELAIK
jgi:hypothetical protein